MNKNILIITVFIVLGIGLANAKNIASKDLFLIDNIAYIKGTDNPYTGKVVDKYSNGTKHFQAFLKNGKQDGITTEWYKDGSVKTKNSYVDGKHDGSTIWWQPNGKKIFETYFINGMESGTATQWSNNGKKISELYTKDGIVYGFVTYEKGEPIESHKNNGYGYTGAITTRHQDGMKQCVRNYKDGKLNGLKKCWLSDGKMYAKEEYVDGKIVGA